MLSCSASMLVTTVLEKQDYTAIAYRTYQSYFVGRVLTQPTK
jgi:hypothetical protein